MKINNIKIKEPHSLGIERYNLTKSGRVASGKMVMDLVAKKWKLTLNYAVLEGTDLDTILSLIDSDEMFFEVEWEDNNEVMKAIMYVGAIKKQVFRKGNRWYWKDVSFDLIEQ
jgi:hypothetical protein